MAEAAYRVAGWRGLGSLPNYSSVEENLLNLRGDPYGGNGSADPARISLFTSFPIPWPAP